MQGAQESYLIIGGRTSLGETIVEELLRRGEKRVAIFDALPLAPEQAARFGDAVRVFVGDILVQRSIEDALTSSGATCVIHTSGQVTPETAEGLYPTRPSQPLPPVQEKALLEKLQETHRKINTDGMRHVIATALQGGVVTRLVYVGRSEIIFDGENLVMLREENAPYPAQPWDQAFEGSSHGERMVLSFNGINTLRTAVVRIALPYGPGHNIANLLSKLQGNSGAVALSIGPATSAPLVSRTFTANAAHAVVLAADCLSPAHPSHNATAGQAFFISDGPPHPSTAFLCDLWTATGGTAPSKPIEINKTAVQLAAGAIDMVGNLRGTMPRPNAWKRMRFVTATRTYDTSRAREVLGYTPLVSYEEGVQKTAEWWLEHQLKICKMKGKSAATAPSDEKPPAYDHEESSYVAEKSPFF